MLDLSLLFQEMMYTDNKEREFVIYETYITTQFWQCKNFQKFKME